MKKTKGVFNTKAIKEEIKILENELKLLQNKNSFLWQTYGSELCAGQMIDEEIELENRITKLKNKLL